MMLNLMIIGAMVLLMVIGAAIVELLNKIEERRDKKYTSEIWGRM